MIKSDFDFFDEILSIRSYEINEKLRCAETIKKKLQGLNFNVKIYTKFGSPIVFACMDNGSDKNILLYSHYDIKHEGDITLWDTDPFSPFYDYNYGKIYARGSGDDKGQLFATIMGVENALADKSSILYNIYLLIEGDEENGSDGLNNFCCEVIGDKKYDVIIINDSHWKNNKPVIYCGHRGQLSIKLTYISNEINENLHAGNFGGLFVGAAREFISQLIGVIETIEQLINNNPTTESEYANAVSLTYLESGDINRSTIPQKASAKIDIRFVESQIPQKVIAILEEYSQKLPISYDIIQNCQCYYNYPDMKIIMGLSQIIESVTNIKPVVGKYCGAYLPMEKMCSISGTKYIIPFAQSDEHNHSPNENISIDHIYYGAEIVKQILQRNIWD